MPSTVVGVVTTTVACGRDHILARQIEGRELFRRMKHDPVSRQIKPYGSVIELRKTSRANTYLRLKLISLNPEALKDSP